VGFLAKTTLPADPKRKKKKTKGGANGLFYGFYFSGHAGQLGGLYWLGGGKKGPGKTRGDLLPGGAREGGGRFFRPGRSSALKSISLVWLGPIGGGTVRAGRGFLGGGWKKKKKKTDKIFFCFFFCFFF